MFIHLAILLAGIIFLFAACWITFCLPGWEFALGIANLPVERKSLIDSKGLRKALGAVFFFCSALFFILLICMVFRILTQRAVLSFCFAMLAIFFDSVMVIYRRFDSSQYPALSRRAGFICAVCVNIILLGLFFVLITV